MSINSIYPYPPNGSTVAQTPPRLGYPITEQQVRAFEKDFQIDADQISGLPTDTTGIILPTGGRVTNTVSQYLANNAVLNVKDFGLKGDGTTDEAPAWNALVAQVNTRGGNVTIYFPDGTYNLKAGTNPFLVGSVYLRGESSTSTIIDGLNGTLFGWGGGTSAWLLGGGAKSLRIRYTTAPAAGSCVFKLDLASEFHFDDLYVENIPTFAYLGTTTSRYASGITVTNVRGQVANSGMGMFDLRYGAGLFCNHVTVSVVGVLAPTMDNTSTMTVLPGTFAVKGNVGWWDTAILANCSFERFDGCLVLSAGSGMIYQDFWLKAVVADYNNNAPVYLESQSGGIVTGVGVEDSWLVSWNAKGLTVSGLGINDFHKFINNRILLCGEEGVYISTPNARFISVKDNQVYGTNRKGSTSAAIAVLAGSIGAKVRGNIGNHDVSALGIPFRAPFGIAFGSDCDHFIVSDNDMSGTNTGYSFANNTGASKNRKAENNLGANYADDPITVTLGGSNVAWVNGTPFDLDVFVSGGAVTAIKKNGQPIGLTSGTVRIGPGQDIAVTYSSTPTTTAFALQ